MFKNYTKIALRNLKKYPGYSLINVSGLAVGIACCLIMILFIRDEISYDTFHEKGKDIYRVTWKSTSREIAKIPYVLANQLKSDYPEIKQYVRIYPYHPIVIHEGEPRLENKYFLADENFFDLFSFELLKGDPETALRDPYTVLITEKKAKEYFGDQDPVGKTFLINYEDAKYPVTVTGVLKNSPENSHFKFDFIGSMSTAEATFSEWRRTYWLDYSTYVYIELPENYNVENLQAKTRAFLDRNLADTGYRTTDYALVIQPLLDIHLKSHIGRELETNGNITYIYVFSAVAFIILLIACVNYMNLATARSIGRAKEVGMRKVMGAVRGQLVKQFLGESVIITLVSLLVSLVLVGLALPGFNAFTLRQLTISDLFTPEMFAAFVLVVSFIGMLSGTYPALYLSRFTPMSIVKSVAGKMGAGGRLRRTLVIIQFAISVFLISGVATIFSQLSFMRSRDLGYDSINILHLRLGSDEEEERYGALRTELSTLPGVIDVTRSSKLLGGVLGTIPKYRAEGIEDSDDNTMRVNAVDHNFFTMIGVDIVQGRNFSEEMTTDTRSAFIINQSAAAQIGWDDPLGKQFYINGRDGIIVGVVEDFHFESIYNTIKPVAYYINNTSNVYVKVKTEDMSALLSAMKNVWTNFTGETPFTYSFVDERYDNAYVNEERVLDVFAFFAGLAIGVACLGLFGLASFTVEQKKKEIGIRKVLGATMQSVTYMISKDFAKLVFVANICAFPAAYFAMGKWLESFPYRTDISLVMFFVVALLSLFIALATVSYQSLKASLTNPVRALRQE